MPDAAGELSDTMAAVPQRREGLAAARSMPTGPIPAGLRSLAAVLMLWMGLVSGTPVWAQEESQAAEQTQATEQPVAPARVNTGLVTIESDQQRADQLTGVVTATGNVRIVYPDERVVATARQAQYFSKENRVVLSGDVDIVQEGGNLIRAERVVYLVDGERLIAIPPTGQQVFSRLRIQQQPQSQQTPTAATTPAAAPAPVQP